MVMVVIIVFGVVVECIKFNVFLIFVILFVAISYFIIGMWKWGVGWLDVVGFYDFVGFMLVYVVGGWGVFVVVLLLGVCWGKY